MKGHHYKFMFRDNTILMYHLTIQTYLFILYSHDNKVNMSRVLATTIGYKMRLFLSKESIVINMSKATTKSILHLPSDSYYISKTTMNYLETRNC